MHLPTTLGEIASETDRLKRFPEDSFLAIFAEDGSHSPFKNNQDIAPPYIPFRDFVNGLLNVKGNDCPYTSKMNGRYEIVEMSLGVLYMFSNRSCYHLVVSLSYKNSHVYGIEGVKIS